MLKYMIIRLIILRCSLISYNEEQYTLDDIFEMIESDSIQRLEPPNISNSLVSLQSTPECATFFGESQHIFDNFTTHNIFDQKENNLNENYNLECSSSLINLQPPGYKELKDLNNTDQYLNNSCFNSGSIFNEDSGINFILSDNSKKNLYIDNIEEEKIEKGCCNNETKFNNNQELNVGEKIISQAEIFESKNTLVNSNKIHLDIFSNSSLSPPKDTIISSNLVLSRKRNINELNLDQNSQTFHENNILDDSDFEPDTKRFCKIKTLLKLRYIEKTHFLENETDQVKYMLSGCLEKYNTFLYKIEKLIEVYLNLANEPQTDVFKILYDENLCILNGFSFDKFGKINLPHPDILKSSSSTADMLDNFFTVVEFKEFSDLMFVLKKSLVLNSESYVEEEVTNQILPEIQCFLQSKESIYLKGISTEFNYFEYAIKDLKILNNKQLIKAFTIFLILVKRNDLVIQTLKRKLISFYDKRNKQKVFYKENIYSSVFFFLFIKYLPSTNPEYIVSNICTSILFNCISDQILLKNGFLLRHIKIIYILKFLFFDLKKFKIFDDYCQIFEYEQTLNAFSLKFPNIELQVLNIIKHIHIKLPEIIGRIIVNIELKEFPLNIREKIHLLLQNYEKLSISKLKLIFELLYTFRIYIDCDIQSTIYSRNRTLLK